MIESYEFGSMVIDGKKYTSDLIVLPRRIVEGWWRREGHRLHIDDLKEILTHKPKIEVLVVGTGYYGSLKVSHEAENALKSHEIKLVAQPTNEAFQTFNELLKSSGRVAGAFHLTC